MSEEQVKQKKRKVKQRHNSLPNKIHFKKQDSQPVEKKSKSPSGLPSKVLVDNTSIFRIQSFKTTDFSRKISYDLIDSVYDRTILKKIITKYKFSIVPNYFQIQVENLDGTRNKELEDLLVPISSIISRQLLMDAVKGFFLYGTSIIYKGDVNENGEYNQLFLLRIQDLAPEYDTEHDYRLVGFKYYYEKEYIFIPIEDVAIFANDPAVGELFGTGLLNNLFETLNQFLNDKLGLTEILDRYALPLVQWAVDVSDAGFLNEDDIILKTRETLYQQLQFGDDIVSDARIQPKIIEFSNISENLLGILQEARKDIGILTIPEPLLGGTISNLSGGKIQQAVFNDEIRGYQAILNDFVVKEFYIPFLKRKGYIQNKDFKQVYMNFPLQTSELPSDAIIWLKQAVEMGLMTFDEARATLGLRGKAPLTTPELEEYFVTKALKQEQSEESRIEDNKLEPKHRDGREPDNSNNEEKKEKIK